MYKIDEYNKKLLYELSSNSRASYSQLGKKINISKQAVAKRINNLKENGVIRVFHTYINTGIIGIKPIRFTITYLYRTPEIEKKVIDFFATNKHTTLLAKLRGAFDLEVVLDIKDVRDFFLIWIDIQNQFGKELRNMVISYPFIYKNYVPMFFTKYHNKEIKQKFVVLNFYDNNKVKVDKIDLIILKLLSENSRIKTIEISKKCKVSEKTIGSRIKNLIKKKVICGYGISIDYEKIGYHYFKTYMYLNKYNYRNQIMSYLQNNPYIKTNDTVIGESHLEVDFILHNFSELYEIIQDIMNRFPEYLNNYLYSNVLEISIHKYFPDI